MAPLKNLLLLLPPLPRPPLLLQQQQLLLLLLLWLPQQEPLLQQLLGAAVAVEVLREEAEVMGKAEVGKARVGEAEVGEAEVGEAEAVAMLPLDEVGLGEEAMILMDKNKNKKKEPPLLCQNEAAGSDWSSKIPSHSKL
jgi:hypothetical protein